MLMLRDDEFEYKDEAPSPREEKVSQDMALRKW
jgi:hypothetical protein